MNWLVTGGCGFIGSNLVRHLRSLGGHHIRVLDNLSVGSVRDLAAAAPVAEIPASPGDFPRRDEAVQLLIGDIRDEKSVQYAAHGADVIVHLAANTGVLPSLEDPRADCSANVVGTLNMLEAAREQSVQHFVLASSGAVLGEQTPPIHEHKVPKPLSPYGASKLAGEGYCSVYSACFGIRTAALRFGNVYGPGSALKNSVVAKFIKQALRGERLVIFGDGTQTRDFIYIDDLVDAIVRAAALEEGGEVFQIATNRETSVNEVAQLLSDLIREMAGREVDIDYTQPRTGEILRNYADVSKAARMLGWRPQWSLRDGLRETVKWYAERESVAGPDGSRVWDRSLS